MTGVRLQPPGMRGDVSSLLGGDEQMHGGLKVYAGAPGAARHYVEAARARADDYYLTEGTGVARRFTACPDRPVTELAPP
jgi:hypothetical protein